MPEDIFFGAQSSNNSCRASLRWNGPVLTASAISQNRRMSVT
jgi:hypothetical protein